jgi:hypothetical protein
MATPVLKSWTPSTTYEFQLIIDNIDYSNDLQRLSIRSSVLTPYDNILFELLLDPIDILSNKIYGQSKIKLTIILKGEVQASDERINMDLMFLRTKTDYHMKKHSQTQLGEQQERSSIMIETIVRNAYFIMNSQVNSIYYGSTPEQIITHLVKQAGGKLEYDVNGKNSLVIDQFLIPPTTLYRAMNYLNRTYGVFNGILSTSCSYEGIVTIQNLSKKIQSDQAFTVYQLATDLDQTTILQSNDPKQFYTGLPVQLINRGNAIISGISPYITYMTKPKDALTGKVVINTKNDALKYGITDKRLPILYDEQAIDETKRKAFHINQTGYGTSRAFALSDSMTSIQDVSMIVIKLNHNLPILNLIKTGSAVNFKPNITDYKPLGGMYILKSCELSWNRSPKMWDCAADLLLMRSNISTI